MPFTVKYEVNIDFTFFRLGNLEKIRIPQSLLLQQKQTQPGTKNSANSFKMWIIILPITITLTSAQS